VKIEDNSNCTGCSACYSACPKSAITMFQNQEGFLYPKINKEICINCGKCEIICPLLSNKRATGNESICYAFKNEDDIIRTHSSSGGFFTTIAKTFIDKKGVVFASHFTENLQLKIDEFDDYEQIFPFTGSKYVQSVVGESYRKCKEYLDKNVKVLFVGTICQIVGLKSFLGKYYENLYTVDIICHGVPSSNLLASYLDYEGKKYGNVPIKDIRFRQKEKGWSNYSVSIIYENGEKKSEVFYNNKFMNLFLNDVCLRESCYDCLAKKEDRQSDFTIGDFWGIKKISNDFYDEKGISLVFVNSQKGKNLFSEFENCSFIPVDLNVGKSCSTGMLRSARRPSLRENFYIDLEEQGFEWVFKRYGIKNYSKKIVQKLKNIVRGLFKVN